MTPIIDTVLILAGGDGDRFSPLRHKMGYVFAGKSVIRHIVEGVSQFAKKTVIVSNVQNKEELTKDMRGLPVEFVSQIQDEGGMADAVLSAKEYCNGGLLVLNANDLFQFSIIPKLVELTHKNNTPFGFVAKHMQSYFPGGYVQFEGDNAVGVVEKPLPEEIPSSYVRLVVDYYQNGLEFISALSSLPTSDDQYEKGMNVVMKKGPSTCLKYEGDWATLKYSWHVLNMQEYAFTHMLKTYIEPSAVVHNTASIEGEVYIGKNVHIGAFVKISGPCVIGDNSVVGDHSLIRRSTLCDNVVVGSGCEVARSYLSTGVMLHRNYVGDSILGVGVSMGAGAVTANYRFDHASIKTPIKHTMVDTGRDKCGLIAGDGVKIGVNASTYPGVKLKSGTVVLPGEVVKKDI